MILTKTVDMQSGRQYVLYATLVFQGTDNYTTGQAGGGIILNFAPIAKATRKPLVVWISGTGASGYDYYYVPGTNAQNGGIRIMGSGTTSGVAKGELATGIVPAGIQNDNIVVEAHFTGEM